MRAEGNERIFRKGTKLPKQEADIVLTQGGLGDYICWIPAVRELLSLAQHNTYTVWVKPFFYELAKVWLSDTGPNHKLRTFDLAKGESKAFGEGRPVSAPTNLVVNATGWHLIDLGYMFFGNRAPLEKEKLEHPRLPEGPRPEGVPDRYIVLTTSATKESRKLPDSTVNALREYCLDIGYTPVLLGKEYVSKNHQAEHGKFNTDGCLDLREKTTLLEAANIIAHSDCTVGLDNGLLHLAACTDAPIVFGYTVAAPEHRRPRRPHDRTYEVLPEESLTCRFCQSNMRGVFAKHKDGQLSHMSYERCIYEDNKCCTQHTAQKYIAGIKSLLDL